MAPLFLDTMVKPANDQQEDTTEVEDGADSDDSSDSLPRDGSFKMMALSPKSSSVKVLEGTNVNDLLESLQDSSGTVPQEVCLRCTA